MVVNIMKPYSFSWSSRWCESAECDLLMLLFLPHVALFTLLIVHTLMVKGPPHDPVTLDDAPPAFSNDDVSSFLKRLKKSKESWYPYSPHGSLQLEKNSVLFKYALLGNETGLSLGDHILLKATPQSLGYSSRYMLWAVLFRWSDNLMSR